MIITDVNSVSKSQLWEHVSYVWIVRIIMFVKIVTSIQFS
jgi:hypothetical protein